MKCRVVLRRWLPLCVAGWVLVAGAVAEAVEPAREFLSELRGRRFYDMALEYLDRMQNSPLAPVELKEVLPYERAVVLVEGSTYQRDMGLREKQLDEAHAALEEFLRVRPTHFLASSAKLQLGNLLQKRASMKVERANSPQGRAQKTTLLTEARPLYEQAFKVFNDLKEDLKGRLASMKKVYDPKTEKEELAQLNQFRQDYLQSQLLAAAIREEMGDTAAADSKDFNDLLTAAAGDYGEIYDKYRTRLAGLYARMYQGRCYQKMKKYPDALSYYAELLEQPDDPEPFRDLKTKVLIQAIDCWLADGKYAEAVARGSAWVDKVRPVESRQPDWMELRLKVARAFTAYADYLKKEKPRDPNAGRSIKEARELATYVAKYPGDLQKDAQKMLAEMRGGEVEEPEEIDPKTFAEAKTAGRDALDAITTSNLVLQMVPDRLKTEKDETIRKELQQQLETAQQSIGTNQEKALKYFSKALQLVEPDTSLEDINIVRYFLCFLFYSQNDFYESALLGDFVSRRYPESAGGRQCAKIALASYLKLYAANQSGDKSFETAQLIGVSRYIVERWPEEPEALDALNTLIAFMIQQGDLDAAQAYLKQIPESSPKRGTSELKTGQAMWSAYLRGMDEIRQAQEAGTQPAAQPAELAKLKDQAQQILSDGIERMRQTGKVDDTMATAVLSLAQIFVDTEQADKAIALLEDETVGALTLVNAKHAAAAKEGFAQETLKTSLRAYIASLTTASDRGAVIGKAKAVMDGLKQTTGATPEGRKRLVAIYISLANDLKKQMELIQSPAAKTALSEGYATFLRQVGSGSDELNVLNWVAETFSGMGESLQQGQAISAESRKYFDEAVATYQQILKRGANDPQWLTPDMKTQVQMRLAMTQRQVGNFKDAMDMLEAILKVNPMTLNVQVEAALTYQQWAKLPEKEDLYDRANKGGRPDKTKKNTVWGWIRLQQLTGRYPQYRDVFHEARYNLAICHLEYGLRKKTREDKMRFLVYAKNDIVVTQRLYPNMGGEKWLPRYDQLLRKIQQQLGEPVVGLKPAAESPATSE